MNEKNPKICLIIPCYNEEHRLNLGEFEPFTSFCYFLFVNDGSTDKTLEIIKKHKHKNFFVFNLENNVGKAEAIRQGMLYLKKTSFFKHIKWVGYWDADLSTSLSELQNFINYHNFFCPNADAILGSRINRLGGNISRTYYRNILSRLFSSTSKRLLHLKFYDSQCGAKIFKKELINSCFQESFVSKWIFDLEIILRLRDYQLVEYPLTKWTDTKGSKIKFLPTLISLPIELIKIKRTYCNTNNYNKTVL